MPAALRTLLQQQHLQGHSDFKRRYMEVAASLGEVGTPPSKAQFYKWLSGNMRGLPYAHHCRVLEGMFPGWRVAELFEEADFDGLAAAPSMAPTKSVVDFADFVGREISSRGVTLVYPTFSLGDDALQALADAGLPRQECYVKRNSPFRAAHRIDVPVAVAENDLRALVYVLSMLRRQAPIAFDIASDHTVVQACDRAFISFGLSSNDCTHMYIRSTDEPLFTIKDDSAQTHYLEYLELADGTTFRSTDETNVGIIARVQPDRTHPGRSWFFCAGLGPRGTGGAAWFFANHWQVLSDRARRNDFVAVLTVQSYSDQTAHLDHVLVVPDSAKGAA
ncbi:MAG: hypothetical protein HOQ24_12460 [Mycobacteriaceae bacterium]|nr:hypothetical protein [Mycobacteriaceae bacterium]